MQYHSTNNTEQHYDFIDAIQAGLAPDGGLFVPDYFPTIDLDQFTSKPSYAKFADTLLKHFVGSFSSKLAPLCQQAFNFPVPLSTMNANTYLLELFHGPTLSFKDFGARFLAACFQEITTEKPITVLVATSGDTGSAVAAAFHQKQAIRVIVLFPEGKISQRQQQQITCWGDNVSALAVKGDFDDCQRLVKVAFQESNWQQQTQLSTSNSINIGRLLPQIVYYAYTSIHFQEKNNLAANFIVPSGNLGNVTAAFWAKQLGFPIKRIVIATNANRPVTHYLETGHYQAFATQHTLANAMDVGNPSNFARLENLFADFSEFKKEIQAISISDQEIEQAIRQAYQQDNTILCPHTATAYWARQQLSDEPWIVVATADPCKFHTLVEPIIQDAVPTAPQLIELLERPQQYTTIDANLEALTEQAQII